jgi:hypothetical protein
MSFLKQPDGKNPRVGISGALVVATTAVAVRRRRTTRCSEGPA